MHINVDTTESHEMRAYLPKLYIRGLSLVLLTLVAFFLRKEGTHIELTVH